MIEFDEFVGIFTSGIGWVVIPFRYNPDSYLYYEEGKIMCYPDEYDVPPWESKSTIEDIYKMICEESAFLRSKHKSVRCP